MTLRMLIRISKSRFAPNRCASAFSRRDAPELCFVTPRKQEGAGKTGCALHPRSRVQLFYWQKRTRAYRFSGGNPAFPAQWFYGLFRALPGEPSSFATVTSQISPQSLAPASGARTTRLRRPLESRSSVATFASTASHRTFVTTRDPPLSSGETGGAIEMICPTGEAEYFCKRGWTGFGDLPVGLFCRGRVATFRLRAGRSRACAHQEVFNDQQIVRHCEERSDYAIQLCCDKAGLLRCARNDGLNWDFYPSLNNTCRKSVTALRAASAVAGLPLTWGVSS